MIVNPFFSDWRKIFGEELYDHSSDDSENINLANQLDFDSIKVELRNRLMQQFPWRIFKAGGLHRLNIDFH